MPIYTKPLQGTKLYAFINYIRNIDLGTKGITDHRSVLEKNIRDVVHQVPDVDRVPESDLKTGVIPASHSASLTTTDTDGWICVEYKNGVQKRWKKNLVYKHIAHFKIIIWFTL